MSAFDKSLKSEWNNQGISKAQFSRVFSKDIANGDGKLTGHTPDIFDVGSLFDILQSLHIDEGAFMFNFRDELIEGANVINAHFKRFGIEMHKRIDGKTSKTKCIFCPPPGYFKRDQENLEDSSAPYAITSLIKR